MTSMARNTDPKTSHAAARSMVASGARGRQALVALALVKKYPGYTYRHLYDRHLAECKRKGSAQVFEDAPSLMRRLSEVAEHRGTKRCPISGRTVARWWVPNGRRTA